MNRVNADRICCKGHQILGIMHIVLWELAISRQKKCRMD